LRPKALDEGVSRPALKREGALLDALDCGVPGDLRFFGFADRGI